jgi:hypothetical protein
MNELLENYIVWIVLGVIIIQLLYAFRIAREGERFAVVVLGRFEKLVGPGLLIKWPGTTPTWHRLSLKQAGTYLGSGLARFNHATVPVKYEKEPKQGVEIINFEKDNIWVAPSNVMSVRCEKCGHENSVSV